LSTLAGIDAPHLMIWNQALSAFESLAVSSVQDLGSNQYRVMLSSPPTATVATGVIISPDMRRRAIVSQAVSDYFDELGPGDFFDIDTDPRGSRTIRFPFTDEIPTRAGALVASRVTDALGGAGSDVELASISQTAPTFPTFYTDGPNMLVPGKLGVYRI